MTAVLEWFERAIVGFGWFSLFAVAMLFIFVVYTLFRK
jgi:hypothetical protein